MDRFSVFLFLVAQIWGVILFVLLSIYAIWKWLIPDKKKNISLLVFLVVLLFVPTMNYAGVCWDKGRILSDDEIIRHYLERVFEVQKMRDSWKTNIIQTEYFVRSKAPGKPDFAVVRMARSVNPYSTVDELLEKHPDRCVVGIGNVEGQSWPSSSGYHRPTFMGKLLGDYSEVIGCELDWKFIDEQGVVTDGYSRSAVTLDNCGNVVD